MLKKVEARNIYFLQHENLFAQKGVNMCNKQSQLATQHCCAKSFTKMLPVLLGLKRPMNQTGLVSHAGSVCRDPGINTPHTLCSYLSWDPGKAVLGFQVARWKIFSVRVYAQQTGHTLPCDSLLLQNITTHQ